MIRENVVTKQAPVKKQSIIYRLMNGTFLCMMITGFGMTIGLKQFWTESNSPFLIDYSFYLSIR